MKKLITISLAVSAAFSLQAQTFEMVKDINPSGSGVPYHFTEYNDKLCFSADDGTNGKELWVSDGTNAGTKMLKDINTWGDAKPTYITEYNGKLYFRADDGIHGYEPWVTDGTTAGTLLFKDINPSGDSDPGELTEYNGKLYFCASDGSNGYEVWVTDGTSAGTHMLKNINTSSDAFPDHFTEYDGKLYFSAIDASHGKELWVTDGTSAGTKMVKDISSSGGSYPKYLTVYNSKLYFQADDGSNGTELWVTDGTAAGTQMVKDINPSAHSFPKNLIVYSDKLYFNADDGTHGKELWVSDGTESGTQMLMDINTTGDGNPKGFTIYNGKLYFSANYLTGSLIYGFGEEPMVTDGTPEGTHGVKDLIMGIIGSTPENFTVYNDKLYFTATLDGSRVDLVETDGTVAGTVKVEPPVVTGSSPLFNSSLFAMPGLGLFFDADYNSNGRELWKLTTAPTGIEQVAFDGDIKVYPNPTDDYVNLSIDAAKAEQVQFHIYDMSGRFLLSEELQLQGGKQTFQFDIEHLSSGSYFYQISNSDGAAYQSGKLIKQ